MLIHPNLAQKALPQKKLSDGREGSRDYTSKLPATLILNSGFVSVSRLKSDGGPIQVKTFD
jgi:hypothetical protein